MNSVINLLMRMLGLGKAVDALDGETSKAYIGGLGMILTGAGTLLAGAGNIASEVLPLHGAAAYLSFAQGLSHDPNTALLMAGAAAISKGLADIGNRHAIAKLVNPEVATQVPQAGEQKAQ